MERIISRRSDKPGCTKLKPSDPAALGFKG
jgi:hypothetical protein